MGNGERKSRFHGVSNNGGSRGNDGRFLRRVSTDHGITPPASLGADSHVESSHVSGPLPRERFVGHIPIPQFPKEGNRKGKRRGGRNRFRS